MRTEASSLLQQARMLRGVPLNSRGWPWEHSAQVLRVTGLRDVDARELVTFTRLEALVVDVVPLPADVVAAMAGLPMLRALEVWSSSGAMADAPAGFQKLEWLSLPSLDGGVGRFARFLESLPLLRGLAVVEAEEQRVPDVIPRLRTLRELDLTGVPIPDEALAELRRACPELHVVTSPISLGWKPGVSGVLRVADGFDVEDIEPTARWETGFEMSIQQRRVTVTERWRETPADAPDYQEAIHGPVDVEMFIRQGPPISLRPGDRATLRRKLEKRLRA